MNILSYTHTIQHVAVKKNEKELSETIGSYLQNILSKKDQGMAIYYINYTFPEFDHSIVVV